MFFSIISFLLSFVSVIKVLLLEMRLNKELDTNQKLNSIICSLYSINLRSSSQIVYNSPFQSPLPSLPGTPEEIV